MYWQCQWGALGSLLSCLAPHWSPVHALPCAALAWPGCPQPLQGCRNMLPVPKIVFPQCWWWLCWHPPSNLAHVVFVPFPPPVDQSMFENASASTAPMPWAQHVPAMAGTLPQPCRPTGSQHLRNLGKAMGAKVNDLLRRKELAGLPGMGAMEVNASAGAVLGTGQLAAEDR